MSTVWVVRCDICGERLYEEIDGSRGNRPDLGVWFNGGGIGIPHVCPKCQDTITISEARRRLELPAGAELAALLEEKPAPSPPARRRRRRTAAA